MGAIFGFCSPRHFRERDILETMAKALEFRGTIREEYRDFVIAMGTLKHTYEIGARLVVDREGAIVAACEGEIYNADELFRAMKHPPQLSEEAGGFDLIPSLYCEKGKDFPCSINGVFTIVLWDGASRTLHLVRDHLGAHSLFYTIQKDSLFFATSAKAILSTNCISAEIDYSALNKYLFSLAISPPDTMFKDLSAVRPGHIVIFKQSEISEYAYWPVHMIVEDQETTREIFAERIRGIFVDAVTVRTQNCDTCGALVSGGTDTTSIVSVLSGKASINRLKGFSIAFEEEEYSDAPLQKHVYRDFKIESHKTILDPIRFADALITGASYLDCPVNDVAYAGMLTVMENARDAGCNIVFEGEGADEIFCTTHSLGEFSIQRFLRLPYTLRRLLLGWTVCKFPEGNSIGAKLVRFLARIGMSDLERRTTWIPGFSWGKRKRLFGGYLGDLNSPHETAEEYYQNTHLKDLINIYQYGLTRMFLPDDLLFKNERMAAAKGILNRTPFIDFRLVETALSIPARYKLRKPTTYSDGTKLIFKDAIKGMIPDEILYRKKTRGFSQPAGIWFRGPLRNFVYDHLFSSDSKVTNYLDPEVIREIYEDHLNGVLSSDYFLNSILILELWMRHHI